MPSTPPFRAPCPGSTTSTGRFRCCADAAGAETVPAFGNSTQMVDHCGNTIGAEERLYPTNTCGDDVCTSDCDDCPGGFYLIGNTPVPPSIAGNTWEEVGTVDLDTAGNEGGRWVQAFKNGHGEFPFTCDASGVNCVTGALANSRYRTITYDVHQADTRSPLDAVAEVSADKTGYRTVGRLTGVITQPTFQTTETDTADLDDGNGPQITYYSLCGAGYTTEFGGTHDPFSSGGATTLDTIDNNFHCTYPKVVPGWPAANAGADLGDLAAFIAAWNSGSIDATGSTLATLTDPNNYSDSATGTNHSVTLSFTRTDTTVTWDFTFIQTETGGSPFTNTFHYYGTVTLSDEYTISDVLADAATQADQWRLPDNVKYPLRTDIHTTVAPVVLLNEVSPPVAPAGFETCDWVDPEAATFDGAIIGTPLAAGYGQPVVGHPRGVFDRDKENFFRRNCTLGVGWTHAQESRGAFTPDYLPANTPKWTADLVATKLWPCAFIYADESGVYLQKWVEIPLKRPSINFARPFGPDKFLLNETVGSVFYVSSFASGVVTLQTLDFGAVTSLPFTTSDIVGSAAVGGFFAVTAVGTNTVTLGALVYALPAGWDTPSHDGAKCFGKLRFPNAPGINFTDPAVGGRVAVTVTNGTPAIVTTGTVQKYLSITTPENIDILDSSMAVLVANVPATRVDDTHFTVTTAYATIATAAWIVPHFLNDGATSGQKYKFCDTDSKGDYVYRNWTIRLSDETVIAHHQEDACYKSSACGRSMVGVTPNGETSPNGHFFAFPTSINNGELWLAEIQFWMADPFWQQPHQPVAANVNGVDDPDFTPGVDMILWSEDDGTCIADSTEVGGGGETIYHLFYPMRPYVEARCTLPDNIDGESPPALASGVDLTAMTTPPGQAIISNVDGPLVDAITLPVPTWIKYLNQKGCVDAPGRFATEYEANGTPS